MYMFGSYLIYGNKTQYRVLDNQYQICPKAIDVPLYI